MKTNNAEKELMAEYGDDEIKVLEEQCKQLLETNKKLKNELAMYKDKSKLDTLKNKLKRAEEQIDFYKGYCDDLGGRNTDLLRGVRLMTNKLQELGYRVHKKPSANVDKRYEYEIIEPINQGLNADEIAFLRKLMSKLKEEQ